MPNKKTTQLPIAGTLTGLEVLNLVQSGTSKQATLNILTNSISSKNVRISGDTMSGKLFTPALSASTLENGLNVIAFGNYSHAEGNQSTASGFSSHAEGVVTFSNGDYSHAEGSQTKTYGFGAHAEGIETIANGDFSHAEGQETHSNGQYSHAEGYQTIANGDYSHTGGIGTYASSSGQTVVGKYNITGNTTPLFIIGNGTSGNSRSDLALFNPSGVTFNTIIEANQLKISALNTPPASINDVGVLGEIRITASFIYVCVATNTWVRTSLIGW